MKLDILRNAFNSSRYKDILGEEEREALQELLNEMDSDDIVHKMEQADRLMSVSGYLYGKYESFAKLQHEKVVAQRALDEGKARETLKGLGGRVTEAMIEGALLQEDTYRNVRDRYNRAVEFRDILKHLHGAVTARQFLLTEVSRSEREASRDDTV